MGEPQDVTADRIVRDLLMPYSHNGGKAEIHIHAGGLGIWACAGLCAAVLSAVIVGSVMGGMWLSREAQRIEQRAAEQEVKIDHANVLLSATWQHAPEVAEKVKQEHPEAANAE